MKKNTKLFRGFVAAFLALLMVLSFIPTALAMPTSKDDSVYAPSDNESFMADPDAGWIDLKATVPGGFSGSVSVSIRNTETDETYTITAFHVNYYANSKKVPYGEYTIERAFTSENNFVYEAFVEEDSFVLEDSHTINVTVTHNEEGEAYVNGETDIDKPSTDPSSEDPIASSSDTTVKDSDQSDNAASQDNAGDQQQEDSQSSAQKTGSSVVHFLRVLIGTAVFVFIVFSVVYLVRRQKGL